MMRWLSVVGIVFFLFGCGPKGASRETLDRLSEAKMACQSAETRAKNLEAQRIKLEEELARKQASLGDLQKQLQELEKPIPKE